MTLAVDVTRHPFSFDPDAKSGVFGSWQDMLHGSPWEDNVQGHHSRLDKQGAAAGIKFQYDVAFDFHPIDSQRLVLWAARFGKQEELVEAMSAGFTVETAHFPSGIVEPWPYFNDEAHGDDEHGYAVLARVP